MVVGWVDEQMADWMVWCHLGERLDGCWLDRKVYNVGTMDECIGPDKDRLRT